MPPDQLAVFHYNVYDIMKDTTAIAPRLATREFIERTDRTSIIEASERHVDSRFVDDNGQLVQSFTHEDAQLLRHLVENGGKATTSGNVNRKPLRQMVNSGWLTQSVVGPDMVEYGITELGVLALEQLAASE